MASTTPIAAIQIPSSTSHSVEQANKRRILYVLQTPLCHVAIFAKRNSNNADVFPTANNHGEEKKTESPTTLYFFIFFFVIVFGIGKCYLLGTIKNCCLVAGFVDLSKDRRRSADTENLPRFFLPIFVISHLRHKRPTDITTDGKGMSGFFFRQYKKNTSYLKRKYKTMYIDLNSIIYLTKKIIDTSIS